MEIERNDAGPSASSRMKIDRSLLVRVFGFPATLTHGDTLVLDRWLWLRRRLPETRNGERLIDIGCGSGAFTIGASLRGYESLGLSWDEREQSAARERASICGAASARFEVFDVRNLHTRRDLFGQFDAAICAENIEHVLDDRRLMIGIADCLKPGGRLLLTTPNLMYRPITYEDKGPFSQTEDGWHVRRGYSPAMLEELCKEAGMVPEAITYCSGFLSQKITAAHRKAWSIHPALAWALVLPVRIFPPLLDRAATHLLQWPYFSICLEAYKPRFGAHP